MVQRRILDIAAEHHQAGRLAEARRLYEEILALPMHPDEADALHLMGLLINQQGEAAKARELIARAIALRPTADLFHINLGTLCAASGLHEEAVTHFRRAVELNSQVRAVVFTAMGQSLAAQGRMNESVDAFEWAVRRQKSHEGLVTLGEALLRAGKFTEAHERINEAILLCPNFAAAHGVRGLIYQKQGEFDDAEHCYRAALLIDPESAELHNNLGHLYAIKRRWPEAVIELRKAVAIQPDLYQAHYNLGDALRWLNQPEAALESFRRAVELKPDFAQGLEGAGRLLMDRREFAPAAEIYRRLVSLRPTAEHYSNLGGALSAIDEMDDALDAMRKAIELNPRNADAHHALGSALQWCGQLDDSMASLRRAMELDPRHHAAHSRLLYSMLFHGGFSRQENFDQHLQWARRHTEHIALLPPPNNDRTADRRLKIGYVSPNFRDSAVMSFVSPIVENREAWDTEVFCYSDAGVKDQATRQLQKASDEWRDTADLSHAQLAQLIRNDRIDILVDLTGHIGDGRLQTFACKPAPIQVSYIGYQATTGLGTMDYFLTDDWANPPGQSDQYFVEKLVRLPGACFCFAPPSEAPPVGPLPAKSNSHITFGCMNNLAKVTPCTIALWCRVISSVPNSRLILLTPNGDAIRDRLTRAFESGGIATKRLEYVRRVASAEYLARYNQIDIALDPVPFNGHTTTCDAAWMGCPTISLAGEAYAYRYGGSVMRNLGLADLVTSSDEQYVHTAVELAADLDRLGHLRVSLRDTMRRSIITNGPEFTRNLEQVYRRMWKDTVRRPV